jgi:hypothetical protein
MTKACVWPSGNYKPICLLTFDHTSMSTRFGLKFEEGRDDLDEYFETFFNDEDIGPTLLLQYKNAPNSGIVIYVDTWVDTPKAIAVMKKKFNISDNEVKWMRDID